MYLRIPNMVRHTGIIKCEYRMMSTSSVIQAGSATKKMNEIITWYEQVTGMDEVRAAQNRVLEEERKLATAQEHRREASKLVLAVQTKLRELHAELDSTPRGDDRYVQLITQEHSLLKEERRLSMELQQYEREERDYFTALSSAVKDSHEKERAQAQRTKYWSIIGSIIGTAIGIAGSSLNNHFKLKEFQKLVKESIEGARVDAASIPQLLQKQEQQLNQIVTEMKTVSGKSLSHKLSESGSSGDKIDKMLRILNQQQTILQNKFNELEALIKHSVAAGTIKGVMETTPSTSQHELTTDDMIKHSLAPGITEDATETSLTTSQLELMEDDAQKVVGVGVVVFVVATLLYYFFR